MKTRVIRRLVGGNFNVATSRNRWPWLLGVRLDYCNQSVMERQPLYFVDDSARDSQLVLRHLLHDQACLGGTRHNFSGQPTGHYLRVVR